MKVWIWNEYEQKSIIEKSCQDILRKSSSKIKVRLQFMLVYYLKTILNKCYYDSKPFMHWEWFRGHEIHDRIFKYLGYKFINYYFWELMLQGYCSGLVFFYFTHFGVARVQNKSKSFLVGISLLQILQRSWDLNLLMSRWLCRF